MTTAATRIAGLERLSEFLPKAGRNYAARRNYDLPGHPEVSRLSPYIRHRLVTEEEVLKSVLARHSRTSAEKFVQEVFWRTYWKGWLEMRPSIWTGYRRDLERALNRVHTEAGLRHGWEAACYGDTGIAAFDHWAKELATTGYLHNHARMWFASIWIFTLRLPWELGADFLMRNLLDADAASNTLSWRWVAGLQTQGKNYVARASNIAKYTEGRFNPGYLLAANPAPLVGPPHPERMPLPEPGLADQDRKTLLVLAEDDLSPGFVLEKLSVEKTIVLEATAMRSPLEVSAAPREFTRLALEDTVARYSDRLGAVDWITADKNGILSNPKALDDLREFQVVAPYVPVGPTADAMRKSEQLKGSVRVVRPYDLACWPHATHGFFKFKKAIPELTKTLGLSGLQVQN